MFALPLAAHLSSVHYMYMGDGTSDVAAFLASVSLSDSKPKLLVLHGRNSNSAVRHTTPSQHH